MCALGYILLLVKNSLDPDQLASLEISLSDFILFSNDTLEIVNVIYLTLGEKQSGPRLAGFIRN